MPIDNRDAVALSGAGFGPIGAGIGGGVVAPDRPVRTGLASMGGSMLGGLGGGLGGYLGGGALGALGGGALGALGGALIDPGLFGDREQQMKEMALIGATMGGGLGAGLGGAAGGIAGSGLGGRAGYDLMQPQEKRSHVENNMYQEKIAYAVGALEKLAEYGVTATNFCTAAVRSQDPQAMKVANLIAEYAMLLQQEKTAAGRGQTMGEFAQNAINKLKGYGDTAVTGMPAHALPTPASPAVRDALENLDTAGFGQTYGPGWVRNADATSVGRGMPEPDFEALAGSSRGSATHYGPGYNPGFPSEGGVGGLPAVIPNTGAMTAPAGPAAAGGRGWAPYAAGGAALAGLGGAGYYGAGPADTWQNDLRGFANRIPGVNMPLQSRAGYALQQLGIGG